MNGNLRGVTSLGDSGDESNEQGDDEDVLESDDDREQANDERTDSDNQGINDDEEESDNEFVHTLEDYVPTDDETNDESKDVNEEEYDRIDKDLYSDVNVRLTDAKQDDEWKRDADMTDVAHVQVKQTQEQTTGVHEDSDLVMVSVQATTSTTAIPDSETLTVLHQRIAGLEKDVKEIKDVDNSTKVISIIKSEVPHAVKEYLGSSLDDALHKFTITSSDTTSLEEFDQKTTLFNTMTNSKSFNKSPKHIAPYHALMELILEDEDAIDKGVADELKKRKPDDADKDEGPSESSKGKSPATSSKSSKSGKSAKDQVVESIFVQDSDNSEYDDADYADMPMDQGEDLDNTDEQPNDEFVHKNDWYMKSISDTSPRPE
ncbi:hypothetical protein Tco_1122464 [Tanacetum coccineum]|uniref:Uncharacterized protein n=1 Tax=Tanacetum coccineum TaxID=301880 RepID=A0ABQ5J0U5_9ASTR